MTILLLPLLTSVDFRCSRRAVVVRTRSTCHETERNATKTKRNTKNSSKRGGRRVVESLTNTNLKFEIEIQLIESAPANRLLRSLGVVVGKSCRLDFLVVAVASAATKVLCAASRSLAVAFSINAFSFGTLRGRRPAMRLCVAPSLCSCPCVRVWIG